VTRQEDPASSPRDAVQQAICKISGNMQNQWQYGKSVAIWAYPEQNMGYISAKSGVNMDYHPNKYKYTAGVMYCMPWAGPVVSGMSSTLTLDGSYGTTNQTPAQHGGGNPGCPLQHSILTSRSAKWPKDTSTPGHLSTHLNTVVFGKQHRLYPHISQPYQQPSLQHLAQGTTANILLPPLLLLLLLW